MPDIARLENVLRPPFFRNQVSTGYIAECNPCHRSFSYLRLPVQLLKLTVLKLDGSCFEVHVARTATVRELKLKVEEIFCQIEMARTIDNISWGHVWGQFCLSYRGLKLIDEKALLRNLGLKDCDQLEFVRHLSINCPLTKERSRIQETQPKWRRKSWPEAFDFNLEPALGTRTMTFSSLDECIATDSGEDENFVAKNHWQSKFVRYLKGFSCYSNPIYVTRGR